MKMPLSGRVKHLVVTVLLIFITACRHTPVTHTQTFAFEQGIKVLATDLADQLGKSSIGNMLNQVNPLTHQKQLKRITIDPFIDAESGYPLKANLIIKNIISQQMKSRYEITGEMDPDNLEASEYVLNGLVTFEKNSGERVDVYKVFATLFEKASGQVLASASVYVDQLDTTPMDLYKDSPVFLKGKNYEDQVSSINKSPDDRIEERYGNRLRARSLMVKGDTLYENQEYNKSLAYYNQLAGGQSEPEIQVLNGQFTNLVRQGNMREAEQVYAKLLRTSIVETDVIFNKIVFAPNSVTPLESNLDLYKMYIRQIGDLVAAVPACRVEIVGHCSRSGSESYNDKLSQQRAEWIHNQMAAHAPMIRGKSGTIGRGFNENLVGSGKDDITDAVDRRVEFKFSACEVADGGTESPTEPDDDDREEEPKSEQAAKVAKVPGAIEIEDIEFYLKNKVSSKLIAARIAERGVNFQLNEQVKKRLKRSKADARIFKAIDGAKLSM